MRVRYKPYARPELAAWPRFAQKPEALRGSWQSFFDKQRPLHLELGCGKGGFAAAFATAFPAVNLLAVDIKSEMLVVAKRKIEAAFGGTGSAPGNVALTAYDIERIAYMMAPADKVERIYINFPNPWPKMKHHKRRLTHTKQLLAYRSFLRDGGEIYFKTDDSDLFEESLACFEEAGYALTYLTRNAHAAPDLPMDIRTEHEAMFSEEGIPIKFMAAKKLPLSPQEEEARMARAVRPGGEGETDGEQTQTEEESAL